MSSITTPFSDLDIGLGAPYRLGKHEQPSRRMYPNFTTDYMQQSDMLIIFTHCYYLQMQEDMISKEIGQSVFATVHGLRTLHVKKEQNQFVVELVRQTDTNIKGEFRVQFRAQSKKGKIECFPAHWHELKHRVEYLPHYTEKLMELYREEDSPGQLNIEIRLAFALDEFNYIVSKVDLNPLLKLEPENDNPEENSISLDFESTTVEQVLSFAFTGLCQMKYYGGSLDSSDFANYHQFLACLHLLKPLMYQELLQMYDDDFCRIFQKECNKTGPPCEASTLQFLRLAIRWGFPKLEASTIARIVPVFPDTYSSHLNVDEQPHIINEMIQTRHDYEMYKESDGLADSTVPQLSPLERIELLKIKCKQVFKWIGQGFLSDISEPTLAPPVLAERNVFELPLMQRPSRTYDATEKIDWKKKKYTYTD